jgi:uncharacterized protein YoxC
VNPWIAAVIAALGLTLVFVIVAVASSISTLKDLGRSVRRFQEEVGGLAAEIGSDADTLGARASELQAPARDRRS